MTKTYKFKDRFETTREKLQELITSASFREEEATKIAGAIEARCTVTEVRPGLKKLVIQQKEYARGMDGKKDTSRTEDVTLTVEWDMGVFKGRWSWRMASQAERVFVDGTTSLVADGNACSVLEEGRVEVKVPMIGGMIEGKVLSGLEKTRPKWVGWLREKI